MNFTFGIRVDGKVIRAGYLSPEIAEIQARGLFGRGSTIEVIDLVTQQCVKRVRPEAP